MQKYLFSLGHTDFVFAIWQRPVVMPAAGNAVRALMIRASNRGKRA
jgi:hypothetical protein